MKYLEPLILKPGYFEPIEKEINRIFLKAFYYPLKKIFDQYQLEILNTGDAVVQAISEGKIYYQNDAFKGEFSSRTSKELKALGAVFNHNQKAWKLPKDRVPSQISMALVQADLSHKELVGDVLKIINNTSLRIDAAFADNGIFESYVKTIGKVDADFEKLVRQIGIVPKFTPEQRLNLAKYYTNNLEFYIRKFTVKNTTDLRKAVMKNTLDGQRSAGLIESIQKNYGVSKNKAKFLARQETSLLVSQIREERYKACGIKRYKWSTSHDERVRPQKGAGLNPFGNNHRILDGTINSWDRPPCVNRETGDTAHPGQDFNCRCVAIPILGDENDLDA